MTKTEASLTYEQRLEALRAINAAASGYSNLEYDLERGERGSRLARLEEMLCVLSDAPAALAVNNNAGAVLLALNTMAEGREVIVSRGHLKALRIVPQYLRDACFAGADWAGLYRKESK